jgi:hypothetical protein
MFDFSDMQPQMLDLGMQNPVMPSVPVPGPFNAAPYLSLFGGGLSAAGSLFAGNASAKLARENAAISGEEAQSESEAGAEQAELYRQHLEATLGKQGASIGGANITTSGSALRSLENTQYLGAQDIARIQTNAARKAWGFQTQQAGDLYRAKQDIAQGGLGALGSLITSGARAYGQWNDD